MSSITRSMKRKMKPHYTHCGKRMEFKESYGYVCEYAGKPRNDHCGDFTEMVKKGDRR